MTGGSSPIRRELRGLTGLRGVAALAVMAFHVRPFHHQPFGPLEVLVANGYLWVDLFFVLSGYVLAMTYRAPAAQPFRLRAYGDFIGRRLTRIYPLFLLSLTASLLILAASPPSQRVADWNSVSTVTENMLLIQGWGLGVSLNTPSWSISTEWACYLLFPVLVRIFLRSRPLVSSVLTLSACVILVLLASAHLPQCPRRQGPLDLTEAGNVLPLVRCLADFSIGLATYRVHRIAELRRFFAARLPGLLLAAMVLLLMSTRSADIVVVMLFPLLILHLASERGPVAALLGARPLHALGCWSYSVYLLHVPIGRMAGLLGLQTSTPGSVVAYYLSVVGLSALTFRFVETPARNWVRRNPGERATKARTSTRAARSAPTLLVRQARTKPQAGE